MPSPQEILHNHTEEHHGQPSHYIDYEEICNYLITKKDEQKDHHDCKHKACPQSELYTGQEVFFHSYTKPNAYIESIITAPTTTPHNYIVEAWGRTCHWTQQHMHPINSDIPSLLARPNTHWHQSPEADQQLETTDHQQQPSTKASQISCTPKLQCPTATNSHPAVHCSTTTSHIPTFCCSPHLGSHAHSYSIL